MSDYRKLEALSAFEAGDVKRSISAHMLAPGKGAHDEPTLQQGYASYIIAF